MTVRRRKYRSNRETKNLKRLQVRLDPEVVELLELHSYDEDGRKLSKAKVIEDIIKFASPRMLATRIP